MDMTNPNVSGESSGSPETNPIKKKRGRPKKQKMPNDNIVFWIQGNEPTVSEEPQDTPTTKTKASRKPSSEDNGDWDHLYRFVHDEILCLPESIPLPRYLIYRLRGLAQNEFVGKKVDACPKVYGYALVEETIRLNKDALLNSLTRGVFADDNHKINYIMKIIESHIGSVAVLHYKMQQTETFNQQVDARHREEMQRQDELESRIQRDSVTDTVPTPRDKANAWRDRYKNMW